VCIHLKTWSERVHDPAYVVKQDSVDLPTFQPPARLPRKTKASKRPGWLDAAWRFLLGAQPQPLADAAQAA
jgi:hypothetical protein